MAGRARRGDGADVAREKATFLAALREGATHSAAAERAGVSQQTLRRWRQADEEFALQVADAIDAGTDRMIDEARRRAVDGHEEPIYHRGVAVGSAQRYSDNLLMFLIKARRPEYRDSYRVEHSGRIEQRITRADEALRQAVADDPELAARLEEIAARIEPDEPGAG